MSFMALFYSLLVIFSIIAVGVFCARKKVLNRNQIDGLEIFLFKITMPCYLFISTLHHDFKALLNIPYICSYLLTFLVVAILVVFFLYAKDSLAEIVIKTLASGYVNAGMFTLPVITFLLGDPIAAMIGVLLQVVLIQTLSITILGFVVHSDESWLGRCINVISTPLVAMPVLGLISNYFQLALPSVVITVIQTLGSGASGIALFVFGLTVSGVVINRATLSKEVLRIVFLKNIIHPIVAFLIGKYLFNLELYWLSSIIIAASAPTAFMVYIISKQFAVQEDLTKMVVAISSIVSLVSLAFIAALL